MGIATLTQSLTTDVPSPGFRYRDRDRQSLLSHLSRSDEKFTSTRSTAVDMLGVRRLAPCRTRKSNEAILTMDY